jgi:hypothetical protein
MGPLTIAEIFARDFAKMVEFDVAPEVVQWGGSTNQFFALVTAIDNTLSWEQGGSIENNTSELHVAKYTADDTAGTLTAQFVQASPGVWDIPTEGQTIILKGKSRRVYAVQESPDGAGWVLKLESPDK